MGNDLRIDQTSLDEFDDQETDRKESSKSNNKDRNRRREIEDLLEERRLKHEINDDFDDFHFN